MTAFLTYSVYALRLSSDLPTQSSFVPLISWYFIFSIILTLFSIIWFYLCNQMLIKNTMPGFLNSFCIILERFFFKIGSKEPRSITNIDESKINNIQENLVKMPSEIERKIETNLNLNGLNLSLAKWYSQTCSSCNQCPKCLKITQNERKKSLEKKKFETRLLFLNNFICALCFVFFALFVPCLFLI